VVPYSDCYETRFFDDSLAAEFLKFVLVKHYRELKVRIDAERSHMRTHFEPHGSHLRTSALLRIKRRAANG
jgi:hypothetical protein